MIETRSWPRWFTSLERYFRNLLLREPAVSVAANKPLHLGISGEQIDLLADRA